MPKLKTNKTAIKRFRRTKPRGGKHAKLLYNKSQQGHLRTKKGARAKKRILPRNLVSRDDKKTIDKLIGS